MPSEDEVAIGREHAGLVRDRIGRLANNVAGAYVQRPEGAVGGGAALLLAAHAQTHPVFLLVHWGLHDGAAGAALGARHVRDHAFGVESGREKCRGAIVPRAGFLSWLAAPLAEPSIALHV